MKILIGIIIVIGVIMYINNRSTSTNPASEPASAQTTRKPAPYVAREPIRRSSDPADFFPTATGTRWEYSITLNKAEPLYRREVLWPMGNMEQAIVETGRFMGLVTNRSRRNFKLVISVKGPAPAQGPFRYPESVELAVEHDELGIYREVKQLFWAIKRSGRYSVMEVQIHDASSTGAPRMGMYGSYGEDGYSTRLVYFGAPPGTAISIGERPIERLAFHGDSNGMLSFSRITVDKQEEMASAASRSRELSGQLREDILFETGKGLVALEQSVDGVPSMTWKLANYNSIGVF